MRCVAYAGMLKAYEEKDLPIEALVGTSGGAIASAAFALGKTPQEIFDHFTRYNYLMVTNPVTIIRNKGEIYSAWKKYLSALIPADATFDDAKIRLAIHVMNADKLESQYLTTGLVLDAVIASCAFILPYRINENRYMDGDYDPETGTNKLKAMGSHYNIVAIIDTNTHPAIVPLRSVQKNAIELDIKVHPATKVFRIMLPNGGFLDRKPVRENYYHGYLQTQAFIKKYLSEFEI